MAASHCPIASSPRSCSSPPPSLPSTPGSRLQLEAHAWPAGRADVTITLHPLGVETEVVIEEQAVAGPGALLPKVAQDPLLNWRNVETLRRLAFLVERRQQRAA